MSNFKIKIDMKKYEKDDTCTELYEQMELILKG